MNEALTLFQGVSITIQYRPNAEWEPNFNVVECLQCRISKHQRPNPAEPADTLIFSGRPGGYVQPLSLPNVVPARVVPLREPRGRFSANTTNKRR